MTLRGLPLFLVLTGACMKQGAVMQEQAARIEALTRIVQTQSAALADLEENFSFQSCGEELALFLSDIRQECDAALDVSSAATSEARVAAPAKALDRSQIVCPAKQVQAAIAQDELLLQARFASALYKSPHAVAYLSSREGTGDYSHQRTLRNRRREERILRLVRASPLRSTRFLLVASPEKPDAEERLRWMRKFLIEEGKMDPANLARPLLYDLKLSGAELLPLDRPIDPEARDAAWGIWLFRLACPTAP